MRRLGAIIAACAALTAAGCGGVTSDSNSTGGGGGGASGGSTPGVTDDTITFGMVGPLTGAESELGLDSKAAVTAMIGQVNDAGGINGRKLKLATQDDAYNPQQSVAGAKYFAGQNPVFAMWGNVGTATTLAALPTYQSAGLPLLFPEAFTSKLTAYKGSFLIDPSFESQYKVLSDYMAKAPAFKDKKIGFLYQNDGTSIESYTGFKRGAAKVAASVTFESSATTYDAQVQKLKSAGVDVVVYIGNPAQLSPALKEASAIGFKPDWIGSVGITSPTLSQLAGSLADGVMTVNPYQAPDSSVPGAARFRAAMTKYQPKATQSSYALNSWIAGLMIVDALKRAGKDLTRQSFTDALEKTDKLQMGGLIPPVTLSPDQHVANDCVVLLASKGKRFVDRSGFICPGKT